MGIERKLNQEQERQVAISYLCGVKTGYIQKLFGVSDATTRMSIVSKRSPEWNDSLVESYRQTNSQDRLRNAIHLYLIFHGQGESLPNIGLIDKERDKPVYKAVDDNIFYPKTYNLITRTTRLERIMETSIKDLSPEQRLLQAVFRDYTMGYEKVLKLVEPLLYQRLREVYQQNKKINIDVVYAQVANEIFKKLRRGLYLVENPQIDEYARKLEEAENLRIKGVLATLAPRENQILRKIFGFEDDKISLEEVAQKFAVTRERIRQIESKALMKLNHPLRLKIAK